MTHDTATTDRDRIDTEPTTDDEIDDPEPSIMALVFVGLGAVAQWAALPAISHGVELTANYELLGVSVLLAIGVICYFGAGYMYRDLGGEL